MNRRVALLLLLICVFSLTGAWAQTSSHSGSTAIKGTVVGADGKAVAAAAVECQSAAGLHPRVAHTDAKGHYLFTGLKQDAYDIRATANGAYSDWQKNIPLRRGQTKEITLHLLNGNTALSGILPEPPKN
jgi:hypothetical protein